MPYTETPIVKLDDQSANVNNDIDIAILQLSPSLNIDEVFGVFDIQPDATDIDGIENGGKIVIFRSDRSNWLYRAYDTSPSSGVVIEKDRHTIEELRGAYCEIVELFNLTTDNDIQWASDYIANKELSDSDIPVFG